jgi:type IV pilus assembly protein PilF
MQRGFFLIIFLMITASCATAPTRTDIQRATAHYQLGMSYLNDNNIQPAYVEFQKALELNPDDKDTHNAIGVIYLSKLEDYPKAIKHFQEALRLDKNLSEAANNLGNAYANIGKYHEAIEAYKLALANQQYRNVSMAMNNIGMVYYRLSKYDDAIDAFKDAIRRNSDSHMPYYGLALCYNAKAQYGDAASAMARAIELDPFFKGDKEKAIQNLKERKIRAKGEIEKDLSDYLDIMNY